jgi:hypothetical protein
VTKRSRWALLAPVAMLIGVGTSVLAPMGPDALVPFRTAVASAASDIYVAVVVDFGGASGAPADFTKCVQVPSGSTDAQALAAAVNGQTAYANSGLLCAISNFPANGVSNCDAASGADYYFWSYWHGSSGSWVYANNGPAEQPAATGDVEGWRFQDPGPANPNAPKPDAAPNFATICPNAVVTTTTSTPSTTTPSNTPTTRPATAPVTVSPAASAATTTTSPHGPGTSTSGSRPAAKSSPKAESHVTTTVPSGGAPGPTTTTTAPAITKSRTEPAQTTRRTEALAAHGGSTSSGGSSGALIVTGTVVVVLGLLSFLRWRRRPNTP